MSIHFAQILQSTTIPTSNEIKLAKISGKALERVVNKHRIVELHFDDQHGSIQLPASAVSLLAYVLNEMAHGNALAISPVHAELTTQEAANLLDVSRPHLIKLLESEKIPFHCVGTRRKIRLQDLMRYKAKASKARNKIFDALTREAQELDPSY